MSPILGIWASSSAASRADTGAMFPLQVITVGPAGASEIEFASIPSTYTHLQIRCSALTAANGKVMGLRLNSDTGANYTSHRLNGDGTSAAAFADTGLSYARLFGQNIGTNTTNPTATIIDILDYANTNKYTTIRTLAGCDSNGSGEVGLQSSLWLNTATITNIRIRLNDGTNYSQYSQFAIYGIKGA